MMPFKTTPEQRLKLAQIVVEMQKAKLDPSFIDNTAELARLDQGVFDLVDLWHQAKTADRAEILADIQESLDDYADAPAAPQEKPYIPYDQLGDLASRVMVEKAKLRQTPKRGGGVRAATASTGPGGAAVRAAPHPCALRAAASAATEAGLGHLAAQDVRL